MICFLCKKEIKKYVVLKKNKYYCEECYKKIKNGKQK